MALGAGSASCSTCPSGSIPTDCQCKTYGYLTAPSMSLINTNAYNNLTNPAASLLTLNPAPVDGDANGTAGGNRTDNFFRLYGDGNGDATVNATDLILFRAALGSSTGSSSYRWFFDVNNDGAINAFDFTQFRANLGKTV